MSAVNELISVFSFQQVCRRILDVDETCDRAKGCPINVVVLPMIQHWEGSNVGSIPDVVEDTILLMRGLHSHGRRECQFLGMQEHAALFLELTGGPDAGGS